jgi:hypothetical protein
MFDVATKSRHVLPNPVDRYHQEGSAPREAEGPESLSPCSLERSARRAPASEDLR